MSTLITHFIKTNLIFQNKQQKTFSEKSDIFSIFTNTFII